MDSILVTGGAELSGEIAIAGAKNACLALMPAALLSDEPLTLTNVPRLSDIDTMSRLLESLGAEVTCRNEGSALAIACHSVSNHIAHYDIVRKMRASNLVLGPMLARLGRAHVSLPGGCAIGARPMNFHVEGLVAMGAEIDLRDGYLLATAPRGLKGTTCRLALPSVGATENLLMAAVLARGVTVLENVAREPEIVDLARCLRSMGGRISGEGTARIEVEGVDRLGGAAHRVMPDRIELGTYMMAPAIAGGSVLFTGGRIGDLKAVVELLKQAGVEVNSDSHGTRVSAFCRPLLPVDMATAAFPGFPTDLQAQFMAMMCMAAGTSTVEECIFENRFMHVPELSRMGARIKASGGRARIAGIKRLKGAPVMATDLRASVSLVLAGLGAEGETRISRVYHLDRGYERLVEKLQGVGARIVRERAS